MKGTRDQGTLALALQRLGLKTLRTKPLLLYVTATIMALQSVRVTETSF